MELSSGLSRLQSEARAEKEEALDSLQKQLLCPICLQIFTKPVVILPCQHNLCRKCANELYQPSLFQARTSMVSSGRFRCPSCRQEVVLDRHGVYGLQRNLLVENIIDVYKEAVCKGAPCSLPPPPPLPPSDLPHPTCEDHEGEKLNIYCLSCRAPTCSLCKVFGAHQSCRVAPLCDVYQQQKDELKEGLKSLEEQRAKIQTVIEELNQMCSDLEESYQKQKLMVCEQLEQVQSSLKERRKSMTEVISAEEEEKSGRAKALMQRYRDTVAANEKLLERATATMEDADSVAFVQSSADVLDKVRAAVASCPSETLDPEDESLSHYQYDFSRQYRVLVTLDFQTAEQDVPEESEAEVESEAEDPEDTDPVESNVSHTQTVNDCPLIQPPAVPLLQRDGDTEGGREELGGRDSQEYVDSVEDVNSVGNVENRDCAEFVDRVDRCHMETVTRQRRPELMDTHQSPAASVAETDEGMSTLQGNAAGSDGDTSTPHQEPDEPEENAPNLTRTDKTEAVLYPGWYGRGTWARHRPINEENQDPNITKMIQKLQEVAGILQEEEEAEVRSPLSSSQDQTLEKSEEMGQIQTQAATSAHESAADGLALRDSPSFSSEQNTESEDVEETTHKESPQISVYDRSECDGGLSRGVLESVWEDLISENAVSGVEGSAEIQQMAPQSQASGTAAIVLLQAVTLLFYLVAFLVILQRFWVYVGRYILI